MNPEDSQQFDDIMGRNFSSEDKNKAVGNAFGGHIWDKANEIFGNYKLAMNAEAEERLHPVANILPKMMHRDEDGLHVKYTGPAGWTHKWYGGPYIEHSHPKTSAGEGNPVDVTNIMDYKAGTPKMLSSDDFLEHCHEFEKNADPKDY